MNTLKYKYFIGSVAFSEAAVYSNDARQAEARLLKQKQGSGKPKQDV